MAIDEWDAKVNAFESANLKNENDSFASISEKDERLFPYIKLE